MNRLQLLLANKHTSGAAIVYAAAVFLGPIAKTWFPHFSNQIDFTVNHLKEACFFWMGISATDSSQLGKTNKDIQSVSNEIQTLKENTVTLTKQQITNEKTTNP